VNHAISFDLRPEIATLEASANVLNLIEHRRYYFASGFSPGGFSQGRECIAGTVGERKPMR
jgi:hypothetical protein